MCHFCWISEGFPYHRTDESRKLEKVFDEQSGVGVTHAVVDDWNLEDEHIQRIITETDDLDEEHFAIAMMDLTYAERWAVALHSEYPEKESEANAGAGLIMTPIAERYELLTRQIETCNILVAKFNACCHVNTRDALKLLEQMENTLTTLHICKLLMSDLNRIDEAIDYNSYCDCCEPELWTFDDVNHKLRFTWFDEPRLQEKWDYYAKLWLGDDYGNDLKNFLNSMLDLTLSSRIWFRPRTLQRNIILTTCVLTWKSDAWRWFECGMTSGRDCSI